MANSFLDHKYSALASNYRLTPATMAHKLNPRWIAAPWLMYISTRIAAGIAKGGARMIISVPPRHGKSEVITKYTTIWALEHFPHWNVILATYGAELSTDFGREVKTIIDENPEHLKLRIRPDASRAARWKTPQGGGMASVGVGGSITGRGANLLLIDDYIKEVKEAGSAAHKKYLWDWFVAVSLTRVEPNGSVIIIATRWAHDDLIGRILASEVAADWEYIELPALCENPEEDPLGRQKGEALFPERYNEMALGKMKATMGSYWFNAIFQQRPEDDDAALTDEAWLREVAALPDTPGHLLKKARIWDLAATEGGGDYTAGLKMVYDTSSNGVYLEDMRRERLSPQKVENLVRRTALLDGTDTVVYIEQEPGSSGKSLVEHYQRNVLPEFKVEPCPANDSKVARAQPFLAACEAGNVFLVRGAWNAAYRAEFKSFPGGDHDDQIDVSSVGYTKLTGKKVFSAAWGRARALASTILPAYNRDNSGLDPALFAGMARNPRGVIFGRRR
jgi:predicted phage terminase large subunit-like protein